MLYKLFRFFRHLTFTAIIAGCFGLGAGYYVAYIDARQSKHPSSILQFSAGIGIPGMVIVGWRLESHPVSGNTCFFRHEIAFWNMIFWALFIAAIDLIFAAYNSTTSHWRRWRKARTTHFARIKL